MAGIRRVVLFSALATALLAAPAGAVTTVGQVAASPVAETASTIDMAQEASAAGTPGYRVPGGRGVIVRWRVNSIDALAVAQLRIFQSQGNPGAPGFHLVGLSETTELRATGVQSFPARIGVIGGEVLGLYFSGSGWRAAGADGDVACRMPANPTETEGTFRTAECAGGTRLNIEADWEPDADRDEFGDDTQDRCPGVGGIEDGCPTTFADGGGPALRGCPGHLRGGAFIDIDVRGLACADAKRVIARWLVKVGTRRRDGTVKVRPAWRCTRRTLEGRRFARITCRKRASSARIRFYERLRRR